MSKICSNCGVKYSNSAAKCIVCGTEFHDAHIYAGRKKAVILGIIGALLIGIAVALVAFFTGPKAAARHIMASFKRNDVDEIIISYPGFLTLSENVDMRELMLDTKYTAKIMSEYILSYRIGNLKTPSEKEIESLMEEFRYFGGDDFDESSIEDIKMVSINYKGNLPMFWTDHNTRFTLVKYNGRWCLWPDFVFHTSSYM